MSSFSFSRLFPSWFSPPSKHPNPALSVDNVMDEHNPTLSMRKRQKDASSYEEVEMKDAMEVEETAGK